LHYYKKKGLDLFRTRFYFASSNNFKLERENLVVTIVEDIRKKENDFVCTCEMILTGLRDWIFAELSDRKRAYVPTRTFIVVTIQTDVILSDIKVLLSL